MAFGFSGRTFAGTDQLKLASSLVTPPGAGLIGLCRPTAANFFSRGFYNPAGQGGWIMGRAPSSATNPNRLGLYRPLRTPTFMASAAAGTTTCTTAAFTPPANCTLLAFTAFRDLANPAASTCVTSGLTWTLIPGADVPLNDGTVFLRQRVFSTSIGNTPASLTVQTTSTLSDHSSVTVIAVPGGGAAAFQVAVDTDTAGDPAAVLAAAPTANSLVVASFHDRDFPASIPPPSGYTQVSFTNVGTNGKLQVVYNESTSDPNVAWTTTRTQCTDIAIEIYCLPLIEHGSANWVDNSVQSFLTFSASASEHFLALNDAGTLERSTTTIPIDSTSAMAVGALDMAITRGAFTGDNYWIGVLKGMPPVGLLDPVMRQLAPPTVLRPWLAHLFPLQGRSPEVCVLTGASLAVTGTTLATYAVPQPQEPDDEEFFLPPAVAPPTRRRVRVTQRNASTTTTVLVDCGAIGDAVAVIVTPADVGGTSIGVAVNGGALASTALGSAAPAQQGDLVVGAPLLDGVPQTEAGAVDLGVVAAVTSGSWSAGLEAQLWDVARNFLRPIINPLSLSGSTDTEYTEDLAPYITDPAKAGYTLALSSITAGLTASLGGTVLTWSAAAGGTYSATLTVTSLFPTLAPATSTSISFSLGAVIATWPNGYRYRAGFYMPAWPNGTNRTSVVIPFAELGEKFKARFDGGLIESSSGWDVRFETIGGVKLGHQLLGYDAAGGRLVGLLNIPRNLAIAETIYCFIGKPGLAGTEANTTEAAAGGWISFYSGWDGIDYSGNGHTLTDSGTITPNAIGNYSAGLFGSPNYRFRSSAELNGQDGFFVAALIQSSEAVGRTQEFLNLSPNDTAQLAMRVASTGAFITVLDVGGQLLNLTSDTGLYMTGEPHAMFVSWATGGRPEFGLDGRTLEPTAVPPIATGVTAMQDVLEIGRGDRPPGTASYFNGQIGPILIADSILAQADRELITAALKNPRFVYGLSDFQEVGDPVPFAAMPGRMTANRNTSTAFDVVANSYNPAGMPLTVAVTAAGRETPATVSGNSILVNPNNNAPNRTQVSYTLTSGALSSSGVIDIGVGGVVVTPPGGFDQSLPMGGRGIGVACQLGQPGNIACRQWVCITAMVEHTGTINKIAWQNRFDIAAQGSTGYHAGNGGIVHWEFRKVTSAAGVSPIVLNPTVYATTAYVSNPSTLAAWTTAYQQAGGSGSAPETFARQPTQNWSTGVAVTAGDIVCFRQVNTSSDGNNNYISTNHAYASSRTVGNVSPYSHAKMAHVYRDGQLNVRYEYYPVLLYGYTDGMVCGNPSYGVSGNPNDADREFNIGRGLMVREVIPVPSWANGKVVRRVHILTARRDNTTSADLIVRVRLAGGSPGGGTDQGSILGGVQAAASSFVVQPDFKNGAAGSVPFEVFDIPNSVTLSSGSTIYVEVSTTNTDGGSTRYLNEMMYRVLTYPTVGLQEPSSNLPGMRAQSRTGSGNWANVTTNGLTDDLSFWLEFV